MTMEFIDLHAQYEKLKAEIDAGIAGVLAHGHFISGPEVKKLEDALAAFVGVKHCIACANGTDALELVLRAWGIGAGDAVFVPAFTFMSTAETAAYLGAEPVFVDIRPDTFNMDENSLEAAICRVEREGRLRPAAVIPVDLFGQCADYERILPIARAHGLRVLEDGAQSFGGSMDGKRACSFGDAAITSFFPAKPLGCYGDGGAMFTDDDELSALLRSLAVHGKGAEKYDNARIGRNSRLDTLQAAILLPKLKALEAYELDARNRVAAAYTRALTGAVETPFVPAGFVSAWAQYTVRCENAAARDSLQAGLKRAGIPSNIYYPRPLHLQTAFGYLGYRAGDLPVSEVVCQRVLSLPMHPYMTQAEVQTIAQSVRALLGEEMG